MVSTGTMGAFTRDLYQTIYIEALDDNRGMNGPSFPRGLCGGGNANGGIFNRPNGVAPPRPQTASRVPYSPRLDNLGNLSHLAPPKALRRASPFDGGPDFRAGLVPPGELHRPRREGAYI